MDLSKFWAYEFYYKYIRKNITTVFNLLFTDTDSLVYEIKKDDIYEDFYENKNLFDFSDYPKDSNIFDSVDKKIIGTMKDEAKGKIISEFVRLKSNMYFLVVMGSEEIKIAKGVNKNVAENARHKEYVDVLLNKKNHKT